jgi:hypothetical protein
MDGKGMDGKGMDGKGMDGKGMELSSLDLLYNFPSTHYITFFSLYLTM